MKIAFVVGGFPKISETWILSQVTALIDRGHQVDIYARRNPEESMVHRDVDTYGLRARTYYFDLPQSRFGRLAKALGALPGLIVRTPRGVARALDTKRYRGLYAVLNNLMFISRFADNPYDVMLCHFGGNGLDLVAVKDAFPTMRFVTMFHGDDYFLGDELGNRAFAPLRELADTILVTTDCFGRATLARQGFDDARMVTLRLSIATGRITFRERSGPSDPVRILTVGRLVPKKGVDTAIRAIAALRQVRRSQQVRYTIVGDGPLRADLAALAQSLGIESSVEFTGAIDGESVMRQMQQADLYLLPSMMEQAGYVLLEAQACGLPVVATRVGGVPEMVREGESALLVPAGDVPAMVAALIRLLDSPDSWPAMGRAGRRYVEDCFDVDRVTPQLERVLGAADVVSTCAASCPSRKRSSTRN